METSSNVGGVTRADGVARPEAPPRGDRGRALSLLVGLVGVVGIAALAASAWIYASTQRDILRLSTEIAQLRLSLDLYMQQGGGTAAASTGGDMLLDLSNRLAILEENWRSGPVSAAAVPASSPAALPATPATGEAAATGGDCLPPGTRFMVAAGDRYPVCGTSAVIEIGAVDEGYISLMDGTVIAQGGNIALPGTGCMVGVVPMEGGAISGFAEIRVTC